MAQYLLQLSELELNGYVNVTLGFVNVPPAKAGGNLLRVLTGFLSVYR